jgi:branched-chain amino acid transport system ATP-binding protein
MSPAGTKLVVNGLHAGYGSMEVVTDVSFEVSTGETVALIGRNGAGKTTSLMAIAGLRYGNTRGEVDLDGIDLTRASAKRIVDAGLAHVPAEHRIFRTLTVEENLRLGAYSRRRAGRKEIMASMERIFELFPILKTYAAKSAGFLSGGEQQMVAIGQALMANPKVLMLDEPTSGLSLMMIRAILEALAKLRDEGLAILIIEQSVPRALANSDRCYVMERGRILMAERSETLAQDERVLAVVRGTEEVQLPASS